MSILEKIFGNYSEKEVKKLKGIVREIDGFEESLARLADEELKSKTLEFKERLKKGETLDDILPEAFAVVREAGKRVLNMRHFEVQLIGGIILHQGRIAEMRTGEGKTLVSTLPAYLNALEEKGVHIVTVNDYLAERDSKWMGELHEFLGLEVGVVLNDMSNDERQKAYNCDITYATNNELGFDYLRDNMAVYEKDMVVRELHYAIIDEVDSVLIDEARTPLIISGSGDKSTQLYNIADTFVKRLEMGAILNEEDAFNPLIRSEIEEVGDYIADEKTKSVSLTARGVGKAEKYFNIENLSDPVNLQIQHHINTALRANYLMFKDSNYVVSDEGEILIVDEFTGRIMSGRRYSDGLHQAIEAKENVEVKKESKTLATVTYQSYFNKYNKKSGMTGTAMTEVDEFRQIYSMDVIEIPTNKPILRKDDPDKVYKTEVGKMKAVVESVKESYEKGQPVLVGTITIENSEKVSTYLKKEGIKHEVLNAKYHEKEAEIVEKAGQKGAVTIATNMAGRGTDIKLGEGVVEVGGLKIIGTERHESRRIDNQLRGRSGRQGDPGQSTFFIALSDDLMRLFGGDRVIKMIDALGIEEDEAIEHPILSKSIEKAQKKIEGNHFESRKRVLDYDRVMNEQREIIYGQRKRVLKGEDLKDNILKMLRTVLKEYIKEAVGDEKDKNTWDMIALNEHLMPIFHEPVMVTDIEHLEDETLQSIEDKLYDKAVEIYNAKEEEFTSERFRNVERGILLRVIDQRWMDHIDDMDQMRQGVGLQSYAQKDPLVEYKNLSYSMLENMSYKIKEDTVKGLFNVRVQREPEKREKIVKEIFTNKDDTKTKKPKQREGTKIGRNELCPCGSGKKYKVCCGK